MTTASVLGTKGEDRDDYTKAESKQIRRRSLRLLGSLISPMRGLVVLTGVVPAIGMPNPLTFVGSSEAV